MLIFVTPITVRRLVTQAFHAFKLQNKIMNKNVPIQCGIKRLNIRLFVQAWRAPIEISIFN